MPSWMYHWAHIGEYIKYFLIAWSLWKSNNFDFSLKRACHYVTMTKLREIWPNMEQYKDFKSLLEDAREMPTKLELKIKHLENEIGTHIWLSCPVQLFRINRHTFGYRWLEWTWGGIWSISQRRGSHKYDLCLAFILQNTFLKSCLLYFFPIQFSVVYLQLIGKT